MPTHREDADPASEEEVLLVLEEDQLVASKEAAHLGRRPLSLALRTLLWGLRIYVVLMLALVVIQVIHAISAP